MDLILKKNRSQVNSKAALTREWEKIPREFPPTSATAVLQIVFFVQEGDGAASWYIRTLRLGNHKHYSCMLKRTRHF